MSIARGLAMASMKQTRDKTMESLQNRIDTQGVYRTSPVASKAHIQSTFGRSKRQWLLHQLDQLFDPVHEAIRPPGGGRCNRTEVRVHLSTKLSLLSGVLLKPFVHHSQHIGPFWRIDLGKGHTLPGRIHESSSEVPQLFLGPLTHAKPEMYGHQGGIAYANMHLNHRKKRTPLTNHRTPKPTTNMYA